MNRIEKFICPQRTISQGLYNEYIVNDPCPALITGSLLTLLCLSRGFRAPRTSRASAARRVLLGSSSHLADMQEPSPSLVRFLSIRISSVGTEQNARPARDRLYIYVYISTRCLSFGSWIFQRGFWQPFDFPFSSLISRVGLIGVIHTHQGPFPLFAAYQPVRVSWWPLKFQYIIVERRARERESVRLWGFLLIIVLL